ncbi:pyruvate dehydrogenase E2 component (dihydrolipoamide acetyltransferase) [Nakamurella panacisegetis]|uniref:Dihydrolipoamide acetyltransferase component of pyruvate dehydrogenase complex n=1 Tax=Nakamurella panacisegetis TaxID=1090615 RepID=A0A1H0MF32_9ACTN|nr:dihydrolipoamide acetyltransferase family protein [Nakamurella panacisegetis]SDO78770.1 pyruvate dehydrogenase E2 component (dihydrolipoamide acetyltransferase) [Nakamurella panacisegetis]
MTNIQTFPMPDVGEGLTEAEILAWHVAVGDTVTVNQIMVEIETAKAAVELPSPYAGRVTALLVEPGVTVDVGTPIISIDTEPGGSSAPAPEAPTAENGGAKIGEMTADGRIATLVGYVSAAPASARRARKGEMRPVDDLGFDLARVPKSAASFAPKATPPVRKLAKDLGVDLSTVSPGRADGVISRTEVEAAAAPTAPVATTTAAAPATSVAATPVPATPVAASPGSTVPPVPAGSGSHPRETRVPVKGVRKMMAQAMVASAFTVPHVTEFLTVDVTPMMELRERLRKRPDFSDIKLSPLAFAARAVCLAARRTPEINSVWAGDSGEVVYRNYVNLGIAAATPRGLIVPVIPDADQLDLRGLAAALGGLTDKARAGKTLPAEMAGGTFTITNVGIFGVDTGTPIINPGESAILALGSIKDAPWVVDGQLAVRKVCQLALSFDHRVIDGQQGSQFLADVGALLADPGLALAF